MNLKLLYETYAFPYCMAVLSLFAGLSFACGLSEIEFPALFLIVPVLIWNALLILAWRRRKHLGIVLILCAAAFCVLLPLLMKNETFRRFVPEYGKWLFIGDSSLPEETAESYALLTSVLFMLILSVPFAAIQKYRTGRQLLAVCLFSALLCSSFFSFPVPKPGAACAYTYLLLTLAEAAFSFFVPPSSAASPDSHRSAMPPVRRIKAILTEMRSRRSPASNGSSLLSYRRLFAGLIPVIAPALLLLLLLPAPDSPYGFPLVHKIWNKVAEAADDLSSRIRLAKLGKGLDFSVSFTGFSEETSLGGDLFRQSAPALSVSFKNPPSSSLYLAGNRKDTYTGNGWTDSGKRYTLESAGSKTSDGSDQEYQWDTLELLYLFWRSGGTEEAENYLRFQEATVTYRDLYTKTLFLPSGAFSLKRLKTRSDFSEKSGGLAFRKAESEGASYSFRYFEWNLNGAPEEAIAAQSGYRYSDGKTEGKNIGKEGQKEFIRYLLDIHSSLMPLVQNTDLPLEEFLSSRAEHIRNRYLSLPDSLPERVRDLAETVTETCVTDYQKVRALEAYLAYYPYTLTPGNVPNDADFTDYFLFEGRTGYCTYYATALAVMARCLGIPSRYVQGYCLPCSPDLTEYEISESSAHAWTECYFEGIGWLPFEPSSGFAGIRYTPWAAAVGSETDQTDSSEEPGSGEPLQDGLLPDDLLLPEPLPADSGLSNEDSSDKGLPKLYLYSLLFPLLALLILFLAFVSYLIITICAYRRRRKEASPAGLLYLHTVLCLEYLKAIGLSISSGETLKEYAKRLSEVPALTDESLVIPLNRLFADFERYRYGGGEITPGQAEDAFETGLLLRRCVEKRIGFVRSRRLDWTVKKEALRRPAAK